MRLVVALVIALASGAPAVATAKPDLPFTVVRVLPQTRQALVYDRARKTHVLVEPGGWIAGYFVVAIDDLDIVVEANQKRLTVYPPEAENIAVEGLTRRIYTPPTAPVGPVAPPPRPPTPSNVDTRMPLDPYAPDPRKPVDPY